MHLSCNNLTLIRNQDTIIFQSLSQKFFSKRITHLTGHNGSGKTSLMRCIAGYIPPYAGQIQINNMPYDLFAPMGYFGHRNGIKESLTVAENFTFCQKLFSHHKTHSFYQHDDLKHIFSLTDLWDMPCHYLSYGQKRRTALACFFLQTHHVYLLDEPINGLDKNTANMVFDFLQKLSEYTIIIMTSHTDIRLDNTDVFAMPSQPVISGRA